MKVRNQIRSLAVGMASVLIVGSLPLLAQVPDDSARPAPKASTLGRRVPPYFGKVGVTQEQKEKIYSIRSKHQQKILDLQQQIDAIKAQELAECEAVLTEPQRKMLTQVRPARKGRAATTTSNEGEDK